MNPAVKLGHKLLQNRYAYSCYQYTVGGTQYRDKLISAQLGKLKPRCVLDLGCGPGPTLRVLPANVDFIGVDLSEDYLGLARKKRGESKLILGDVTDDKWVEQIEGKNVDLSVAMGLFHHLSNTQLETLVLLLERAMKPGSTLISADPSIEADTSGVAKWFALNDRGMFVRSHHELVSFFDSKSFKIESKTQKMKFNIPLDTVELVITRSPY